LAGFDVWETFKAEIFITVCQKRQKNLTKQRTFTLQHSNFFILKTKHQKFPEHKRSKLNITDQNTNPRRAIFAKNTLLVRL